MLTRETMAAIAAIAAILAGSQAIGAGEVADVIFVGIGLVTFGWQTIEVGKQFVGFWVLCRNLTILGNLADHLIPMRSFAAYFCSRG